MNPILMNPKIDDTASVQVQLKQMKSYLFQFKEQIELMLQNIDKENLSGNLVEDIDTIRGGIRQYEVKIDGFSSKIAQTANMVSAKLSSDDVDAEFIIGRLNDGSTYATIDADRIDVDGVFTANGSFEVADNGDLTFKGAGININTSDSTTDVIQLNSNGGTRFTRLSSGSFRIGSNSGYAQLYGAGSQFQISFNDGSAQTPFFQYLNSTRALNLGRSGSSVYVNDGTDSKKVQWTPLSSLTNDMYVLTDGGT